MEIEAHKNENIIIDNNETRKSLSSLSKQFIMMFLKGEKEIFFEDITKNLIGNSKDPIIKCINKLLIS